MRKTPKRIFAGGITQVAAGGQHTCAITQNKILWCWGDDGEGQVGDGKF
jgi:alpha-tubulin suppressor-like RCC1 family protein